MHQRQRAFGDVHGQVADTLEIGVDLERGGQEAQIAGDRLPERQRTRYQAVNLHFHLVDLRLIANHLLGDFPVLVDQGANATVNRGFHQPAHLQQLVVQFFQFDCKMAHFSRTSP